MLKKLRRSFVQSAVAQTLFAWIAYLYLELVYFTSRWQHHNIAVPQSFWDQGKPMIVCFWHNRLLCIPRCWRKGVKATMLISSHRDGRFISSVIGHYGFETTVGSTSRGSAAALRGLMDKIEQGYSIGITPDGPRGPRFRAAQGATYIAKVTGLPVISVSVATTRRKMLRSWDRFLLCLPFSSGVYVWGDPIYVPSGCNDDELESYRQILEKDLIDVSNQSDLLCGQAPIPLDDGPSAAMMPKRKAS